jgi:hypothetical protein
MYKGLVGKSEENGPQERPRRRREYNIKTDRKQGERVWAGFIWLRIKNSHGFL